MRCLVVILCLLLSSPVKAIEGRFVNYGSTEGLPSGSVYAITQDADGFLWVGTRNGLCRFDGTGFKVWKEPGRVNALTVDRENRLWVGTMDGLLVRCPVGAGHDGKVGAGHDGKADGYDIKAGPSGNIRALLTDSDGAVWAMVGDTLILKLSYHDGIREDARCWYDKRDHEGDYPYFQLYEDAGGRIWPAGRIVRCQFIADRQHPVSEHRFGGRYCTGSVAEVGGTLYACDDHLSTLNTFEGEDPVLVGRLPVAHARLFTDSHGRLWAAGSYGLGLIDLSDTEASPVFSHKLEDPSSLSSGELYCIFEDRQGNLWVGGDNGLSVLCPALQQVHMVSRRQVTAIMQASDGKIWTGTAEDRVSSLYEDSAGTVYVGLWNNTGWQVWKDGRMHKERLTGPTPREQWDSSAESLDGANWISSFLEDSRGRFWVVTWEGVGLNEWDRKAGRSLPPRWLSPFRYPSPQVDSNIYVSSRLGSSLIEDTSGNLIYGTTEAGLNIIDMDAGLVTKYFRGNSSIPDDYVSDLCLSPDSTVWAATRSGLWSPSGRHCLDGMLVQSVEADASGRLWAGTEDGLYFVDTDGSVGRCGKGLGFPSDIYGERVSCTLADGSLAFGGASGAAVFHPDSLLTLARDARSEPGMTGSVTPGLMLPVTPGLMLPVTPGLTGGLTVTGFSNEGTSLQFSFSVKNLPLASLLQYRYRVSGVDADWIVAEYPRLQGRYNSLFPGRYNLEIQCTDIFGRWQGDTLTCPFRIRFPLLLRWPFLLLYLLLLSGAAWLFVRYRENRQRAIVLQEELDTRNRFFDIISHDLRNPVSGMDMLASALEKAPDDKLRDGVKAIGAAAQRTSALLENLLMWSVSQKDVLRPAMRDVLLARIVSEAAGTREIETDIPEGLTVRTDPNMLATCIRNLLDNALKFSPEVRLRADAHEIVVTDHGPGMDGETLRTLSRPGHLGLVITKELLEKMGASLCARNLPEGGCEVTIHLS